MKMYAYLSGAALVLASLTPTAASAATAFSEDFSGATPNAGYTSAITGTKFTASGSDVDVLGVQNGAFFSCIGNSAGNCIDTVGSRGAGATITSTAFGLTAGTVYTLSFTDILQGFSAGDPATATYTASVGGFSHLFTSTPTVTTQTFSFTPLTSMADATLAFTVLTSPDSSHGPVLSNIAITSADSTGAVPEPASWAMMIAGFGMVGAGMRRRKTVVRFA